MTNIKILDKATKEACFELPIPPGVDRRDMMNLIVQRSNDIRTRNGNADKNVPLPFPERMSNNSLSELETNT